ncbi:protein-disulfide reductase DsbD domain-containing protein [Methylomonas rivi]|uniref:Protein-disulfide reductase DsbD family protein n=1 Tax=Methylomonas rivi TaxID=2952226 RepID=A0ABT1U881_9GAMM|nr:protein-disulfide reductase DsbD domain-containing protein [Methylomonas sp. WSC-6]MCQ8130063.1 protein-disulfide reductase DsbD family protein [Methylomonas sp. WSC-6]
MILLLCGVYTRAAAEQDLLEPDQAFEFSSEFKDAHILRLSWRIADGYYLYRQKFQFVSQTPGIDIGEPVFPGGQFKTDKQFGSVEIYRDRLILDLAVQPDPDEKLPLRFTVTYQGCADVGVCYMPIQKQIALKQFE